MATAAFSVNGGVSPAVVTGGSTVNLALLSTSGVGQVEWSILGGSDSTQTKPVITVAGSPPGSTASFTMSSPTGTLGVSWVVQCQINAGIDANRSPVAAYTATALVGVLNSKSIIPFAAFESFERNAITGIADDLNQAVASTGGAGTVAPTFSDSFTATSATANVIRNIGLSDNAVTRIVVVTFARNTTTGWYKKKSSTEWTRSTGGGAVLLGDEDGPIITDNIGVTGMTIVANGNGVDIKFGGSGSVHTRGVTETYLEAIPIAVAT